MRMPKKTKIQNNSNTKSKNKDFWKSMKKCKSCDKMVRRNNYKSHCEGKQHLKNEKQKRAQKKMRSMESYMYSTRPYETSPSFSGYSDFGGMDSSQGRRSGHHKFHHHRRSKHSSGGRANHNHRYAMHHWGGGQADPEPMRDMGHSREGRADPEPMRDMGHSHEVRADPEPMQDMDHLSGGWNNAECPPQFMNSREASSSMKVKTEARAAPPVKRCKTENESMSMSQLKMMSAQPSRTQIMAPSEEVSRMQLALELTVQEDGLRRRATHLNTEIEKQRVAFDVMKRTIEQLEAQKASVKHEELTVKERRMQIIRDSYALSTPSTIVKPTPVDPYGPCSSSSNLVKKQEAVEVAPYVIDVEDNDDDEVDVEEKPISKNITAKVRERVMSQNESGSMSFADLDDVVNNIVNISSDDEEPCREAESRDRQRRSDTDEVEKTAAKTLQIPASDRSANVEMTSIIRGAPSVQTSSTDAKKKQKSRDGQKTSTASTKGAIRSVSGSPGCIEAHKGEVNQLRIFKGQLFSCGGDGRIQCFDPWTHAVLMDYQVSPTALRSLCLTDKPNGKPKIFSFVDQLMFIYDMKSGQELKRLAMDVPIKCITLSFFTVFIGLSNGAISSYDMRKDRVIFSKIVSSCPICSLVTTGEGKQRVLVVATADGKISVMNVNDFSQMRTIGQVSMAMKIFEIRSIDDKIYTFSGKVLREFPVKDKPKTKSRMVNTQVTSIITHNKRLVVIGCQDGSVRYMDVSQGFPKRMKVYYAAKRCSAIVSLCCQFDEKNELGLIAAGNRNGQIFVISVSDVVKECKVGNCDLDFEFEEDLVCHVMGDHVLSSMSCRWNNSCLHRYSRTENREAVKLHIRSHL